MYTPTYFLFAECFFRLRKYTTSRVYPTKRSARNHAAFFAYHALYEAELLNKHLLPLTSTKTPDNDGAVKLLLQDIEKRAGHTNSSVQFDPWQAAEEPETWFYNEVSIEGFSKLFMFARSPLPALSENELPTLYVPSRGAVSVGIHSTPEEVSDQDVIVSAKMYTKRMFSTLYEKRMSADKLDFAYLFLPMDEDEDEADWRARREWQEKRLETATHARWENGLRANADALSKEFAYPLNISLVRQNEKFDKILLFVGWHDGPLTDEEAEAFLERYPGEALTFPLIVAQEFPKRRNFLAPLELVDSGSNNVYPFLIHPKYAIVDLVSSNDVQCALFLPSVLRFLSIASTVHTMKSTVFASTPRLASIPFSLLKTALTAPVSQEAVNYQRLETLGDTVLKFVVSSLLHAQYPLWHEGYLARRKDHAVNNNCLAKEAIRLGMEKWLIRDRFVPRKWKPRCISDVVATSAPPEGPKEGPVKDTQTPAVNDASKDTAPHTNDEDDDDERRATKKTQGEASADSKEPNPGEVAKPVKKKKAKQTEQLSTKMLADVVESLIGAAYEHGGFDLAIECTELFGLGIPNWSKIPACIEMSLANVEDLNDLPPELTLVETMLGYQFTRRTLLVEALTHASYTGDIETQSYERLEFLGDAVLDMIVTDFLYHAPGKNYTPGHMHIRKESMVNSHLLAFICMSTSVDIDATMPAWNAKDGITLNKDTQRIHLYRCLLHSSPKVLEDLTVAFSRWEKHGSQIQRSLEKSLIYPWAALTSLQAPKFISDMLESILGAVFLDSNGSFDVVKGVLKKLGIMSVFHRIVADDVDVLHPVSRLAIWAAKNNKEWQINSERIDGDVSCVVAIGGVEQFRATELYRGKTSQNEVRFAAAEGAIRKLHVIEEEAYEDLDEVDWGDIPEYT